MGLTKASTGIKAADSGLNINKQAPGDMIVALAGNPNVGKSTVFNALTGMKQHTGNWPGKTVSSAQGYCKTATHSYILIDIPGTYSLMAHSAEEEIARNFICFGEPDVTVVVCDATCLERNLNLVLQTLEITKKVIVCVNLMDEAARKHIKLDLQLLESRLGVPVIGTAAKKKRSLNALTEKLDLFAGQTPDNTHYTVKYPDVIESAVNIVENAIANLLKAEPSRLRKLNSRWLALQLISPDSTLISELENYLGIDFLHDKQLISAVEEAEKFLAESGYTQDGVKDIIVSALVKAAESICCDAVVNSTYGNTYNHSDRKIDRILTSRKTGYPVMVLLLIMVFWLTISGANYPSALLAKVLFGVQDVLTLLFEKLNAPHWLYGALVLGVYRVLAWVISVMLPPMLIFFPLFTLLEDLGYLPRIAYNLDNSFKRCKACGKQALTMCMGFGCNAAGVVGCRIIDSPRERLLAILTNSFVPCNGRFPTLIAILSMFFVYTTSGILSSFASALMLALLILFGIGITFVATKLLSTTVLRGLPSSFVLELPPYRKPQFGRIIIRSIFDRTLFVLGRAAASAAPAGLIIWLSANIELKGVSLLKLSASLLEPFAQFMGLDGVILIAFILGSPANEIVIPIMIMAYMAEGSISAVPELSQMKLLLTANGWTATTALCTMIFSLLHWPCTTTLLTIKKETGSLKWTAFAAVLPTAAGIAVCIIINFISKLSGLA